MNGKTLYPVDRIVAGYNVFLALVWAQLVGRVSYAPLILIAHGVAAFMPRLLERTPETAKGLTNNLRQLYPLLWLLAFWTELDYLRVYLHQAANDAPIIALDSAIFGVHWSSEWIARMPQVWFSELMHFCYFLYYPLIFIPPLVLAMARRKTALRDVVLRLIVTYLACYVVYIVFPVDGPHYLATMYPGPHTEGFFYNLVRSTQGLGDSRGAAFPSSHVTGAVTIAIIGWRWFNRPIAALLTLEAIGVVMATVYTQNHYAVDSLTGIAWAFALQGLLVPALKLWLRPTEAERLPVPQLPAFRPAAETGGGA